MATHIKVCVTESEWADAAADEICRLLEPYPETRRLLIALAGGTTPRPVYERLAVSPWRDRIPWNRVCWGWGDERWVSPTEAQSNFRLAYEAFLSKVDIGVEQIRPMRTEGCSMLESACEYEAVWREWLSDSENTVFALALLGIGADGHTASLFPGSPALHETCRWAMPAISPQVPQERITLTLPLLNQAQNVLVLVRGAEKHAAFRRATHTGSGDAGETLPIELIHPRQNMYWMLDQTVVEGNGTYKTNIL